MLNLLKKKWINRNGLNVSYENGKMIIENKDNYHKFLVYPKLFHKNKNKEIYFDFQGNLIEGNGCSIEVLNRHKTILARCGMNSIFSTKFEKLKYYIVILYVQANSKVEITKMEYKEKIAEDLEDSIFENDTLLITPGYPSLENKYNTAFVHTRVQAYKEAGLNVDLVVCNCLPENAVYEFEGVKVLKTDYYGLRNILQKRKYKNIIIHFFDDQYANVLDSIDLTETKLFLYSHGADILYRDFPKFASNYFEGPIDIIDNERAYQTRDAAFIKYNNKPNVKWMFVSQFVKDRAEEIFGIEFKNSEIIPCFIDDELFKFEEKDPELRKKIFIIRRFTNDNCYALDIDMRAILELSKKPFFNELEFDIYGDGEMHDILVSPVVQFPNVHIHRKFLSHEEINQMQKEHGIGLFASRFDTQGVSICEAISSGCAVVTSKIPAINSYIDDSIGVTCNVEEFKEYADVIEKMYKNPDFYKNTIEKLHKSVSKKFGFDQTIAKEIDIIKNSKDLKYEVKEVTSNPVLSIIIPSYNVSKYLRHGVASLINQRNVDKIEILIVNDGSKDNTAEIGKELEKITEKDGKSVVRLIDKENGGHGSTINVGIREAKGKYLKVMDGDDTVDSERFADLIDILEKEDTDIILNDYLEDWAGDNRIVEKKTYPFMAPGIEYRFEDLCYEGYGFDMWGPILSCSTYKTEMLKKADFYLTEKCFYVDMELNTYVAIACNTIKYYPMYVYRYLLGRTNQSVTKASYMKNVKLHEKIIFSIINILEKNKENISELKKNYIINKIILTMIISQYLITIEFYNKGKYFREFDKELKKHKYLYDDPKIATRGVKFHRKTNGRLIFMNSFILKVLNFFRKIKNGKQE